MGKLKGRSRRSMKPKEAVKEVKSSFEAWVNERLVAFEFIRDKDYQSEIELSTVEILLTVAQFWMQPENKQIFTYADRLCRGKDRMKYRIEYSNGLLNAVICALDRGCKMLAKVWLMTFGILMESELHSLIDIIHIIEIIKAKTTIHDDVCTHLRLEAPYLVLCMWFTKNRATISEWLLKINQTLLIHDCLSADVAFQRCWITVANKTCGKKIELYINVTCKIKTLLSLFADDLEISRCCRIVHRGRSIFMSGGGDEQRLHQLGVQDRDFLVIIDIASQKKKNEVSMLLITDGRENKQNTKSSAIACKALVHKPKRLSSRKGSVDYSTAVPDRVAHSLMLTRVFEEADAILSERRRLLNELAIKKKNPKPSHSIGRKKQVPNTTYLDASSDRADGKPGKIYYPVIVGEPNFLYRSSKVKRKTNPSCLSLDLHGCTREKAFDRLNDSLPVWMDAAHDDHPYTINVDIICGGGSQILSEVVEAWIKTSKNVANRFG